MNLQKVANFSQKAAAFLLFGATCYYGTFLIHGSYVLSRRRKERILSAANEEAIKLPESAEVKQNS